MESVNGSDEDIRRAISSKWVVLALGLAVFAGALCDARVAFRGLRGGGHEVSPDAMRAAAAAVRARLEPGTIVVHSPLFGLTELQALGDLVARPDLPPASVRSTHRVVVLDREDFPMFGFGRARQTLELADGLVLRVFEPEGGGDVTLFDLHDGLASAKVWIERPPGTVASLCSTPKPPGGVSCPGQAEWLYAAPVSLRIGGEEAPCVWAHPTTGGVLVFELPKEAEPSAGRSLVLDLALALTDDAVRGTADGAEVVTTVVQGGVERARLTVPNRIGWVRGAVALVAGAPTLLRITTPQDGRRHHCINARISEKATSASPPTAPPLGEGSP